MSTISSPKRKPDERKKAPSKSSAGGTAGPSYSKKQKKRIEALAELFNSERSYLYDLKLWRYGLQLKILKIKSIPPRRKFSICKTIFVNLHRIYSLHKAIFKDMKRKNSIIMKQYPEVFENENLKDSDDLAALDERMSQERQKRFGDIPRKGEREILSYGWTYGDESSGLSETVQTGDEPADNQYMTSKFMLHKDGSMDTSGLEYASCFLKRFKRFNCYKNYVSRLLKAEHEFNALRENNFEFDKAVIEFLSENRVQNLGTKNFFYRPSGKMARYALLLKAVLKNETQDEYRNSYGELIKKFKRVTKKIDKTFKERSELFRMYLLSNKMALSDLASQHSTLALIFKSTRLIKEGHVLVQNDSGQTAYYRNIYLFNRFIALCDIKDVYNDRIYVTDPLIYLTRLVAIRKDFALLNKDPKMQAMFPIYIIHEDEPFKRIFYFEDMSTRDVYFEKISKAISKAKRTLNRVSEGENSPALFEGDVISHDKVITICKSNPLVTSLTEPMTEINIKTRHEEMPRYILEIDRDINNGEGSSDSDSNRNSDRNNRNSDRNNSNSNNSNSDSNNSNGSNSNRNDNNNNNINSNHTDNNYTDNINDHTDDINTISNDKEVNEMDIINTYNNSKEDAHLSDSQDEASEANNPKNDNSNNLKEISSSERFFTGLDEIPSSTSTTGWTSYSWTDVLGEDHKRDNFLLGNLLASQNNTVREQSYPDYGMSSETEETGGFKTAVDIFFGMCLNIDPVIKNVIVPKEARQNRNAEEAESIVVFSTCHGIFKKVGASVTRISSDVASKLIYDGERELLFYITGSTLNIAPFNIGTLELVKYPLNIAVRTFFYERSGDVTNTAAAEGTHSIDLEESDSSNQVGPDGIQVEGSSIYLVVISRNEFSFSLIYLFNLIDSSKSYNITFKRKLYIGFDVESVAFVNKKMVIASNDFEIIEINTLLTQEFLDIYDPITSILYFTVRHLQAIAVFRIDEDTLLLCFDGVGFYVDSMGRFKFTYLFFIWECKAREFKIYKKHVMCISKTSISVFSLETAELVFYKAKRHLRIVPGTDEPLFYDGYRIYRYSDGHVYDRNEHEVVRLQKDEESSLYKADDKALKEQFCRARDESLETASDSRLLQHCPSRMARRKRRGVLGVVAEAVPSLRKKNAGFSSVNAASYCRRRKKKKSIIFRNVKLPRRGRTRLQVNIRHCSGVLDKREVSSEDKIIVDIIDNVGDGSSSISIEDVLEDY